MKERVPTGTEILEGVELHPEHESWVRITTHNSLVGVGIFLAIAALFVIVIDLHLSRGALAVLGVLGALILLGLIYRSTPQRRRGFLANVELTARIKADLITQLGANHVNVDSSRGVVTLRGSVPYADFREAAEHLARRQGAHRVINELKVAPSATGQPDPYLQGFPGVTTPEGAPEVASGLPLEERVREALEDDPRVHASVLVVRVEDGIAYLTGRQETEQASEAATEVAAHVPGILGVSNDIEILPSVWPTPIQEPQNKVEQGGSLSDYVSAVYPCRNTDCHAISEWRRMMTTQTTLPSDVKNSVIAIYGTHERAEAAVKALQHHGVDMTKLSIVGKDYHTEEHVVGYYNTGDRMKSWGKFGAFWGGLWGFLFGSAFFFIPGIGPIAVAGPLVAWIVGALEGAVVVGGLSALGAALVSIGIPKDSALKYETELQAGKFILIAHGTAEETGRAKALLELTHHEGLTSHTA